MLYFLAKRSQQNEKFSSLRDSQLLILFSGNQKLLQFHEDHSFQIAVQRELVKRNLLIKNFTKAENLREPREKRFLLALADHEKMHFGKW